MYHSTWSPLILCVYIYVGGIYTYVHSCVYVCGGGYVECFSFFLSTLFLQGRDSHWTCSSPLRLDCLVPLISCIPSAGWCHVYCHAWLLCGCSGSKLRSSCFHSDTVPTKPSPQPFPLILPRFSRHFHLCSTLPSLELSYWQLYETLLTLSRSLWVHPVALSRLYSLTLYFLFGCCLPPHPHHKHSWDNDKCCWEA